MTKQEIEDLVKEDRVEWLISEDFIDDESEYFVDEYPSGIIVWML